MKYKTTILIILAIFLVAFSNGKDPIINMLNAARNGEDVSQFWVGGIEKQKLFTVIDYEVLSSVPLHEAIQKVTPKIIEANKVNFANEEKRFAELDRLQDLHLNYSKNKNHSKARGIWNEMDRLGMDDDYILGKNTADYRLAQNKESLELINSVTNSAQDLAKINNGLAFKVRINSTNKLGFPVIFIWTISTIKAGKEFKITYIYKDDTFETNDIGSMVAAISSMVGVGIDN